MDNIIERMCSPQNPGDRPVSLFNASATADTDFTYTRNPLKDLKPCDDIAPPAAAILDGQGEHPLFAAPAPAHAHAHAPASKQDPPPFGVVQGFGQGVGAMGAGGFGGFAAASTESSSFGSLAAGASGDAWGSGFGRARVPGDTEAFVLPTATAGPMRGEDPHHLDEDDEEPGSPQKAPKPTQHGQQDEDDETEEDEQ